MDSLQQFSNSVRWTAAEKKVARRAFDLALERRLSAITAQAKSMIANVDPSELWQVEAYLTESRKTVDRIFQFRYSDLLRVFSTHAGRMVDGGAWLACNLRRSPTSHAPQRTCVGYLLIRRNECFVAPKLRAISPVRFRCDRSRLHEAVACIPDISP